MNELSLLASRGPEIWLYLLNHPVTSLLLTLLAYQFGLWCFHWSGRKPYMNPVLIAVTLLVALLQLTGLQYANYIEGARFIHFLLGIATVALAIPIYKGLTAVRGRVVLTLALVSGATLVGGGVSIGSAVFLANLMGVEFEVILTMWAKSVTAPIAIGVSERLGASATLTTLFAILTGIMGATLGTVVFNFLRLKRNWVQGFTLGLAAHGIGTARAFSVHPEAGRYASLGMGLHGIFGAMLIPWLYRVLG
ncbi:MAG TPA: LrgB family protein [Limnobacter sp.]|nr:LrgB family protein [Limnobacter sp.]